MNDGIIGQKWPQDGYRGRRLPGCPSSAGSYSDTMNKTEGRIGETEA